MTIRREYGDGHDPEERKGQSGMPYCYFCEACGLEIEQSAGVAANHERACKKRKARNLDIARDSDPTEHRSADVLHVIVVKEYPPDYRGAGFRSVTTA